MKTHTLLLAIVAFALVSCRGSGTAAKKTDAQTLGLTGKIKTVAERYHDVTMIGDKAHIGGLQSFGHQDYEFNSAGGYEFITDYDDSAELAVSLSIYTYNAEGKLEQIETEYYEDNKTYETEYDYDDKGNISTIYYFNADGQIDYHTEMAYDDKGNRIVEKSYNSEGDLTHEYQNKYDENGFKVQTKFIKEDGEVDMVQDYKYDSKGNLIENKTTSADVDLSGTVTHKYDNRSNQVEELNLDADGNEIDKTQYEYEFDDRGNWITKISYVVDEQDGRRGSIAVSRKIEYIN